MRPGELGAGVPRAAQHTHVWGPCVARVCTAGRAVTACMHVLCLDCEPGPSVPRTPICGHHACCRSPKPYRSSYM
eukprot:7301753-Prymnesium_polylepis.1